MDRDQRLINFSQAGQYLGIKESAFRERVKRGLIPPNVIVRIGGRLHVDLIELDAFIEAQKDKARNG